MDERRQGFRRLITRLAVAIVLSAFAFYNGSHVLRSDPKTGQRAFTCASKFNKFAHMWFTLVIIRIGVTPSVMERMRRARESCDMYLVIGSISLFLSLAFSAYLRWFVVSSDESV